MRIFDKIVTLRRGEAGTAWLMFAYSFLAMTSHNIVRPLTRSKSITAFGAVNMPWLLLGASFVIAMLMVIHSTASRRLPGRAIIPVTQGALAALLLGFWFLFRLNVWWVPVAFFVFGLLYGILMISQFWTLANDIYDARQARRIFGFIGGGACLGGAVGAGLTAFTVERIGTSNLVLASVAVLIGCIAIVMLIERRQPPSDQFAPIVEEKGVGVEAIRLLRESRHLQLIALVIGFAAIGATVVDQQLNMAAEAERETEDAISALLGLVTMYLSLIAFLLQIGLTSRIHRSLGLMFALLLLPVGLGVASVAILATGALWAVAGARVLDTSLRYTIDKTTREVLFLPLPAELKHRAKPFVDVTMDRFAKGAGALLMLVLVQKWGLGLDWRRLSYASLIIIAVWVVAALIARRGYLQAFRRSLDVRGMSPGEVRINVADAATVEALIEGLSSPDDTAVLYAIEMLETLDKRHLITPLLLHHESAAVRARTLAALELIDPGRAAPWLGLVERLLKDPDADVRAAAVRALAALRHADRAALMREYLQDAEPRVVVTAAADLADSGRPADAEAAEAALARIIGDTRTAAAPGRRDAAAALGRIRNPAFRSLLVQLIHDPDVEVARDAIASARAIGPNDALFVPALVSRLGHRQLKAAAREAVVSYGDDVIGFLAHVLGDQHEHVWVRRHVPATLARMPVQRSMDALIEAVQEPDGFLRYKVVEAIETLRREHPELTCPPAAVEALIIRETTQYCSRFTLRANIVRHDPASVSSLLVKALDDKLARGLDRTFRLLGVIYPWKDVAAAREGLERGDARTRVNAMEYLDNVLGGTVRKRCMPLFDDAPLEDKLRHADNIARTRPRDLDDSLAQLIHDDDAILAASAIAFLRSRPIKAPLADDLEFVLDHREADPVVREAAAAILGSGRHGADRRAAPPMPVVFVADRLRAIPLFAFVSVDELVRLASVARQTRHEAGSDVVQQGALPTDVRFLIEGAAHVASAGGAAAEVAAPAALGLADVLEGRPLRESVTALTPVTVLALAASDLWSVLSDSSATAQGLFRMLLGTDEARAWAEVHRPGEPVGGPNGAGPASVAPVETAARLRQAPIFGRATVDQLLDLVAITREVRLASGSVLLGATRRPAVYHLVRGEIRLDGGGDAPVLIGPGSTIGVAETLTDMAPRRTATVTRESTALRLDHRDLFEVLADHPDLLQGVFSGALQASERRAGAGAPQG